MEPTTLRDKVVNITIKSMDEPPNHWKTFNDNINTTVVSRLNNDKKPNNDECPILECKLDDNYLLITTDKIVSKFGGQSYGLKLKEVTGLSNRFNERNYSKVGGKPQKTIIQEVLGENGQNLIFEIDSHHPAYFATLIILNLSTFLRNERWYLNPDKDFKQSLKRWKSEL
ncbi:MAG: hypothetical protein AAF960_18200 [Bacteroidota bacterium]